MPRLQTIEEGLRTLAGVANSTTTYSIGDNAYTVTHGSSASFTTSGVIKPLSFIGLADNYNKDELLKVYFELQEYLLELYPKDVHKTLKLNNIYKDL